MKAIALAALTLAALLVAPVRGAIIIQTGNNPQPGEQEISFNQMDLISMGTTVTGVTNQSDTVVSFTSNETLVTPAQGQARVAALDGSFNNYVMAVPGGTFSDYIFNLQTVGNASGQATITANEVSGPGLTSMFSIGNGQNFFTVLATGSTRLTSVEVNTTVGLTDVRQNRVSGATGNVPEPGSLFLIGSGLIGVAVIGARRRKTGSPSGN